MNERVLLGTPTCSIALTRPAPGVALVVITGHDTGRFGDRPLVELERLLPAGELFIDVREARGASIEVSGQWAAWLMAHPQVRTRMLVQSQLIRVTAEFVQRFAQLGDAFRIDHEVGAFEAALGAAIAREALQYAAGGPPITEPATVERVVVKTGG